MKWFAYVPGQSEPVDGVLCLLTGWEGGTSASGKRFYVTGTRSCDSSDPENTYDSFFDENTGEELYQPTHFAVICEPGEPSKEPSDGSH